jgi:hypothetical protein
MRYLYGRSELKRLLLVGVGRDCFCWSRWGDCHNAVYCLFTVIKLDSKWSEGENERNRIYGENGLKIRRLCLKMYEI